MLAFAIQVQQACCSSSQNIQAAAGRWHHVSQFEMQLSSVYGIYYALRYKHSMMLSGLIDSKRPEQADTRLAADTGKTQCRQTLGADTHKIQRRQTQNSMQTHARLSAPVISYNQDGVLGVERDLGQLGFLDHLLSTQGFMLVLCQIIHVHLPLHTANT